MKNLLKVSLIATAFILATGCSSSKPAPAQPTVTEVTPEAQAPVKKCSKKNKKCRHHHDKLGQTSYEKDTAK